MDMIGNTFAKEFQGVGDKFEEIGQKFKENWEKDEEVNQITNAIKEKTKEQT